MFYIIVFVFLIPFLLEYRKQKAARDCYIAEILEKGKERYERRNEGI